ncbi:hypothetical protein M758_10G094800 [Ceratodon purpureus]|nr:hypothetical protein M758_10G094700 [Ceratodon purpureus]KAG0603444.1 hypothetical protein M758_10G094800 [Ceratodon purpureus]
MRIFYHQCKSYLLPLADVFLFLFVIFFLFLFLFRCFPLFIFHALVLFHIDGLPLSPLPQPLCDAAVLLISFTTLVRPLIFLIVLFRHDVEYLSLSSCNKRARN